MPLVTVLILVATESTYNHLGDKPLANSLDYINRNVETYQLDVALLPGQDPRLSGERQLSRRKHLSLPYYGCNVTSFFKSKLP